MLSSILDTTHMTSCMPNTQPVGCDDANKHKQHTLNVDTSEDAFSDHCNQSSNTYKPDCQVHNANECISVSNRALSLAGDGSDNADESFCPLNGRRPNAVFRNVTLVVDTSFEDDDDQICTDEGLAMAEALEEAQAALDAARQFVTSPWDRASIREISESQHSTSLSESRSPQPTPEASVLTKGMGEPLPNQGIDPLQESLGGEGFLLSRDHVSGLRSEGFSCCNIDVRRESTSSPVRVTLEQRDQLLNESYECRECGKEVGLNELLPLSEHSRMSSSSAIMGSRAQSRKAEQLDQGLDFNIQVYHKAKDSPESECSLVSMPSQPILSSPQSKAMSESVLLAACSQPCTNTSSSCTESQKPARPRRLQSRERMQHPDQFLKTADIVPRRSLTEVTRNEMMRKRAVHRVVSEQRARKHVEQEALEARMLNYIKRDTNSTARKNSARRARSESDKKSLVKTMDEYLGTKTSHSLQQDSEVKGSRKQPLFQRPPFMAGGNNRDRPPQYNVPSNTKYSDAFQLPRIPQVSRSSCQTVEQASLKWRSCDVTRLPRLVAVL